MSVVSNPVVVMKRYEMKYIMSPEQTAQVWACRMSKILSVPTMAVSAPA